MKRIVIFSVAALLLSSCGKGKSGKQIADEVCDCSKKANALPATDPNRSAEQNKCTTMQQEAWAKVKDDDKKSKEFNEALGVCATEQIKKSFGQ